MVSEALVTLIDAILTMFFWVPAKLIGYEKCSKCTVRVRWFQFLLLVTWPFRFLAPVESSRIDWDLRVHPPQRELERVSLLEI